MSLSLQSFLVIRQCKYTISARGHYVLLYYARLLSHVITRSQTKLFICKVALVTLFLTVKNCGMRLGEKKKVTVKPCRVCTYVLQTFYDTITAHRCLSAPFVTSFTLRSRFSSEKVFLQNCKGLQSTVKCSMKRKLAGRKTTGESNKSVNNVYFSLLQFFIGASCRNKYIKNII